MHLNHYIYNISKLFLNELHYLVTVDGLRAIVSPLDVSTKQICTALVLVHS